MPSKMTIVEVNGLQFRCALTRTAGADRPWLLFSNSLMTDLTIWDEQVAAFATRYNILRYDQRGHGGTAVPPDDCTFDMLADDVTALMDRWDLRTAIVVGVSMGGVTAMRMLARHPERVAGAAICDAGAVTPPDGREAWEERMAVAREGGMQALVEPTIQRWFAPGRVQSDAANRVRSMIAGTPFDGFVRAARALQDFDLRASLAAFPVPVLTLAGSEDGGTPRAMRAFSQQIPQAEFVLIEGAGHLPNIDRADEFNQQLSRHLERVAA